MKKAEVRRGNQLRVSTRSKIRAHGSAPCAGNAALGVPTSRLMHWLAVSAVRNSSGSPRMRAALRTSRHVSSSREMVRTIVPSGHSVSAVTCTKLTPQAQA